MAVHLLSVFRFTVIDLVECLFSCVLFLPMGLYLISPIGDSLYLIPPIGDSLYLIPPIGDLKQVTKPGTFFSRFILL